MCNLIEIGFQSLSPVRVAWVGREVWADQGVFHPVPPPHSSISCSAVRTVKSSGLADC